MNGDFNADVEIRGCRERSMDMVSWTLDIGILVYWHWACAIFKGPALFFFFTMPGQPLHPQHWT